MPDADAGDPARLTRWRHDGLPPCARAAYSLPAAFEDATNLSRRARGTGQPCYITIGSDVAFRNRGHDLPYALGKGVLFVHTFTCGDVWNVMVNEVRPDCCACLRKKPASGSWSLAIGSSHRDNAPARWLSTLSMGALLVLPQRYSVHQVRSGRKQPGQTTWVPGCSWQGPHPFVASSHLSCFSPFLAFIHNNTMPIPCNIYFIALKYYCHKPVIIDWHFIIGRLFSSKFKKI